jgi:hypothetical protein
MGYPKGRAHSDRRRADTSTTAAGSRSTPGIRDLGGEADSSKGKGRAGDKDKGKDKETPNKGKEDKGKAGKEEEGKGEE